MSLTNKTILLTGGTGSFGQEFVQAALKEHDPKAIRIFSRGELLQQQMSQKFDGDPRLRFFIGDVRDRNRVYRAMNGVDIVVHAAALKQVPTCEYNPIEAVRTNIDGAVNIIDAAIDNGVEKAIAISTDKAVSPVNLYGGTKLVAEKLVIQSNNYAAGTSTRYSCVRYGNVVGSRGSVVPLFLKQRANGKITITDERMTRFWLSLEQGVHFVISCIEQMEGGEVFVPKIPSTKVIDLAHAIAPEAEIEIIGIRPGEKLHEGLLSVDEARNAVERENMFVIKPPETLWNRAQYYEGTPLPEGFSYTSDTNKEWLDVEGIKKYIEPFEKALAEGTL